MPWILFSFRNLGLERWPVSALPRHAAKEIRNLARTVVEEKRRRLFPDSINQPPVFHQKIGREFPPVYEAAFLAGHQPMEHSNDKDPDFVKNQQQNIADAIDLLPRLTTGIDVSLRFTRFNVLFSSYGFKSYNPQPA